MEARPQILCSFLEAKLTVMVYANSKTLKTEHLDQNLAHKIALKLMFVEPQPNVEVWKKIKGFAEGNISLQTKSIGGPFYGGPLPIAPMALIKMNALRICFDRIVGIIISSI